MAAALSSFCLRVSHDCIGCEACDLVCKAGLSVRKVALSIATVVAGVSGRALKMPYLPA